MQVLDAVKFEKLKLEVDPAWWATEGGEMYLRKRELTSSWVAFLECFKYDVFFTVTFGKFVYNRKDLLSPSSRPASSGENALDRTSKLISKFFQDQHMQVEVFLVAEEHKSGAWHAHGLMRLGELGGDYQWALLTGLWRVFFEKFGRNEFKPIRDMDGVSGYVSKYLTKKMPDYRFITAGKKRA